MRHHDRARRGVSTGFTMIELLIVIIIIGILAAIAIPRFTESKRLAYVASMKSDLRNMVSAAESKFAEEGTYVNYVPPASSGVKIVYSGTIDGWSATATHPSVPGIVCRIERGPEPGTANGPVCE